MANKYLFTATKLMGFTLADVTFVAARLQGVELRSSRGVVIASQRQDAWFYRGVRMRNIALGLLMLAPLFSLTAHADESDAKLAAACPSMAAWMTTHEHAQDRAKQADAHATFTEPAIRANLLNMAQNDMKARNAFIATGMKDQKAMQVVDDTDAANLKQLKTIVDKQGFPTVAQVGTRGVNAMFLLIQHADSDPAFQEKALTVLQARTGKEAVDGWNLAMLTDRVLGKQGKPQRYGTQFQKVDGKWVPNPIEDPSHVEERRAKIGLPPMSDYACMIKAIYGT
jgi:hypothetical protein